jgi:HNH endonuclease
MSRYISDSLRRLVAKRANYCCEYCQLKELDAFFTFPIDHIISVKHGGITTDDNLAHSCTLCNTYKGSDIGTILLPNRIFTRLFNPRIDSWDDHFELYNYVIYAKTYVGEATVKILKLNDVERIIERQIIEENR